MTVYAVYVCCSRHNTVSEVHVLFSVVAATAIFVSYANGRNSRKPTYSPGIRLFLDVGRRNLVHLALTMEFGESPLLLDKVLGFRRRNPCVVL